MARAIARLYVREPAAHHKAGDLGRFRTTIAQANQWTRSADHYGTEAAWPFVGQAWYLSPRMIRCRRGPDRCLKPHNYARARREAEYCTGGPAQL
jgi:hypothetical protein